MSLLSVLKFPDNRLRLKAKKVEQVDQNIQSLASDMLETMYHQHGIGLAATQVNQQISLIVIDASENRDQSKVIINPKITKKSGDSLYQEGCLSVPGIFAEVKRSQEIDLEYTTLENIIKTDSFDGLTAICIQHEIDHLEGILFIDYLEPHKLKQVKELISSNRANPNAHIQVE